MRWGSHGMNGSDLGLCGKGFADKVGGGVVVAGSSWVKCDVELGMPSHTKKKKKKKKNTTPVVGN